MIGHSALRSIVAIAFTAFASATAGAQAFRTYLAPTGVDSNPCTLPLPCRLLPAALAAVASGGEIWMLDSANYNTATVDVNKSVTILAVPGALGSVVTTATGPALRVNTAGVKLALRNLVIVPLPGAGSFNGVLVLNGAGVSLDGCLVANMPTTTPGTGNGIQVNGDAYLRITDTTVRNNGGNGVFVQNGPRATITRSMITGNGEQGVFAYATVASTFTSVDIADSTLNENGNGGLNGFVDAGVVADISMSVKDSRIVRNSSHGLSSNGGVAGNTALSASNNIIANNNGAGIVVFNVNGRAWASGNTISTNVTGLWNTTGTLETAGNNSVRNNDTNITGTVTKIAQE